MLVYILSVMRCQVAGQCACSALVVHEMRWQISAGTRAAREGAGPAMGVTKHWSRPAERAYERHH